MVLVLQDAIIPIARLAFRRDLVHMCLIQHAQLVKTMRPGRPQPLNPHALVEIRFDREGHLLLMPQTQL